MVVATSSGTSFDDTMASEDEAQYLPVRKQKVVNSLFHPPYQAIMSFLSQ